MNRPERSVGRWDRTVRVLSVGVAVVLLGYLGFFALDYFNSDYQYAQAAQPPSAGPPPTTQLPPEGNAENGAAIVKRVGCNGCHSIDGTIIIGPSWLGVAGSEVTFTDGTSQVADRAYLFRSILTPNAQVVEGFKPDVMPQTFSSLLSMNEIADVVAYIQSLG